MSRHLQTLFLLAVLSFLFVIPTQAQVTTASMSGTVMFQDEPVIGATVLAVHEPSGTNYGTITNVDGRFSLQGSAEILYKQVCEQLEQDDEIKDYAQTYSKMKPKEAAAIFDSMTDNLSLVAKILNAMDAQSRGNILGKMDSATAAKVTKIMNPSQN